MESRTHGPASLIGQSVGGYRLERMLGKGATGAVFLGKRLAETPRMIERTQALPIELPDEAAIKVLILPWQLEEDGQTDFRARFLREAQTLQRLQHPHIVAVLDHGEDPTTGHTYMVLPYMAGGTLATRLGAEAVPLDEIASTLAQIAEALDYAHRQGIVHRDIKPGNILLDARGQAYVGDFSIVRLLDETHTRLTSTGRVIGTPEYMAPEQIDGRDVGAPADIYSLGMVVYQLATGRVAFSAPSIVELIRLQAQEPPPLPRTLRADLPEPAEAAILCALDKDPAKRFTSAAAFAEAFSLGLQGQWAKGLTHFLALDAGPATGEATTQTLPRGIAEQPWPRDDSPRRNRWQPLVVLALATLILLVAGAVAVVAIPSNPVLALLKPPTSAAGTHTGALANITPARRTATAGKHTSGTGGGSKGGGTGGAGTGGGGAQPTATPTRTPTPTPTRTPTPTPIPTYYETATSNGSGTFTQYWNAGGPGQRIAAYQTVQVSCRLTGFVVADGNPWWYRIKSSPWNNQYYAPADNFYNNGQTSGPNNTIWVDTNVPLC